MAQEFCPSCGEPRVGSFGFCRRCGLKLDSAGATAAVSATQPVRDGSGEVASAPPIAGPVAPSAAAPPPPKPWWKRRSGIAAILYKDGTLVLPGTGPVRMKDLGPESRRIVETLLAMGRSRAEDHPVEPPPEDV